MSDVDEGGSADERMAQVRPAAPAGTPLARARVFEALFGRQSTADFGRFRIIRRLGAGGMGVVYEAYDPDLARGVALKLVDIAGKDRDTALREAKTLARLSHPNVVPIYDVGAHGDHVFLVMELVQGKTLRHLPERAWRAVLAIYEQVGRALAAAHAAGLVHRDFKPDNAIIGADGRVRVVDFGLACEADDPAREAAVPRGAAGTPGFMAPEIAAGAAVTPAADQYSFCVALAEALEQLEQPAPRRIALALQRGRSDAPGSRFASMDELLRALARDPARTRRRALAIAGLVAAVGVGAFAIGRRDSTDVAIPDVCDDGPAHLAAVWTPAERATALARLAGLGNDGPALAARLQRDLDALAVRWVAEHRAGCHARLFGADSDRMSGRRTACLNRATEALAAVRELVGRAQVGDFAALPKAVQSLPDPAWCGRLETLFSELPPPRPELAVPVAEEQGRIARARVLVGAGEYKEARASLRDVIGRARGFGYGPLLAEALLVDGHAMLMMGEMSDAVSTLEEATSTAVLAGADALAVEAWARWAYVVGRSGDPVRVLGGLHLIEPLAKRTDAATSFARALLYNNLGSVELARDGRVKAREYFLRAVEESRRVAGRGALELISARANLALVTDDLAAGDALLQGVAAELVERLGENHPEALAIQKQRALVTIVDLARAEELLAPVCASYRDRGDVPPETARCWVELGLLRSDLGRDGAADAMDEAHRASAKVVPETGGYRALFGGDAIAASAELAVTLAATPADALWQRLDRARLLVGLGRARRAARQLPLSQAALQEAIAELDAYVAKRPQQNYDRRLGRARVELALVLSELKPGSPELAAATKAARAWVSRVGADPRLLAPLGR